MTTEYISPNVGTNDENVIEGSKLKVFEFPGQFWELVHPVGLFAVDGYPPKMAANEIRNRDIITNCNGC